MKIKKKIPEGNVSPILPYISSLFFSFYIFNREERNIMIPEKEIFKEDIGEELECNKSR